MHEQWFIEHQSYKISCLKLLSFSPFICFYRYYDTVKPEIIENLAMTLKSPPPARSVSQVSAEGKSSGCIFSSSLNLVQAGNNFWTSCIQYFGSYECGIYYTSANGRMEERTIYLSIHPRSAWTSSISAHYCYSPQIFQYSLLYRVCSWEWWGLLTVLVVAGRKCGSLAGVWKSGRREVMIYDEDFTQCGLRPL